jgi:acyl-CoA synthetase (NDP forming)
MLNLEPLLWPRSIAIIGASPNLEIIRGRLLHVLRVQRFPGPIFPVTRSHAEIHGLKAYPSIEDLPERADLAIIAIPAAVVPDALARCAARGVKAAVVLSSGFAEERGAAGRELQATVREIATRHGLVVCGPNSEGLVNTLAPMAATFSPSLENPELRLAPDVDGSRAIAVISQSGGLSFSYLNRGRPRQLRFTYLVSSGNEVCLEGLDYVDYMLGEGRTDLFLMYVEAMKSGDKFRAVAGRAAGLGKPLIVAKVGRSDAGRRAAASHTASLAGADHVYDAMFRRYGVVRSHDFDEMLDLAAAFAFCPLPRGRRVGLLSASGGGAVWMADLLAAHGLALPELAAETRKEIDALIPSYGSSQNPVDLTAQAVREVGYARVIDILRRSPSVDAVVVVGSLATDTLLQRDREALAGVAAASDKPIVFCAYTLASPDAITLLARAGIPAYTSLVNCARAVAALADYAAFQARWSRESAGGAAPRPAGAQTPPPGEAARAVGGRLRADAVLCEHEAKDVLAAYGVPRPREELVESEEGAAAAAARVGYPVALKVQSPDITHKTEAGAVALALDSETAVRAAYPKILAGAAAAHPDARVRGVLVQRMAAKGVEVILGITRDADFGPILMVGLGGIHVEVLGDVVFTPVPVTADAARELIGRLRGAALLQGVRGEPPADVDALADLVVRLSRFAADHGDAVAEVDLNPVIVHPAGDGLSVVDALIVTRRPGADAGAA